MFLLCPRPPRRIPPCIWSLGLLSLPYPDSFSDFLCFWWPWQSARFRCSHTVPQLGLAWCFPQRPAVGYREEDDRSEALFSSGQIEGTCHQPGVALLMLTLVTQRRSCVSGLSPVKLLSRPFALSPLGGGHLCHLHTRAGTEAPPPPAM